MLAGFPVVGSLGPPYTCTTPDTVPFPLGEQPTTSAAQAANAKHDVTRMSHRRIGAPPRSASSVPETGAMQNGTSARLVVVTDREHEVGHPTGAYESREQRPPSAQTFRLAYIGRP